MWYWCAEKSTNSWFYLAQVSRKILFKVWMLFMQQQKTTCTSIMVCIKWLILQKGKFSDSWGKGMRYLLSISLRSLFNLLRFESTIVQLQITIAWKREGANNFNLLSLSPGFVSQGLSSFCSRQFCRDCLKLSQEFWPKSMPMGKVWRKKTTEGKKNSASVGHAGLIKID